MNKNKRNSLWLALQYLIGLIISLITLKLNLSQYGEQIFGGWILLSSLWGFGKVIDLGYGTALIKYIAEFKNDPDKKINSVIATSFLLFIVFGFLIFIIIVLVAEYFYLNDEKLIRPDFRDNANTFFLILGAGFYFRYISTFFRSIFEGYSEFVFTSKLSIILSLSIFISVVIVYLLKLSLIYLSLLYSLSSLLIFFILVFKFNKFKSLKTLSFDNFSFGLAKQMTSFSIGIQGASIFGNMIDPIIKYSLGHFYSINSISYYEIAQRFSTGVTGLFNTTFRTVLPKASALKTKEEVNLFLNIEGSKLSKLGITYAGLMYGVMSIGFTLFIKLWFGFDEAVIFFLILSLSESINKFGFSIYNFFMGTGRVYFLAMIQLINLIIVVFGLFLGFLIFKNNMGLLGYFVTTMIVNVLMLIKLKAETGYSITKFLMEAEVIKLLLLVFSLLTAVCTINFANVDFVIPVTLLSLCNIIIFYSNIRKYSLKLFSLLTVGIR
ncbi:MAG: oligosaccharide flippase family protein [Ignavibacteriales bacterium]|nr:oligosaccharide flippase family protein [Ignavibacteriales bacterium]